MKPVIAVAAVALVAIAAFGVGALVMEEAEQGPAEEFGEAVDDAAEELGEAAD
jgi:hypothetical protein